MNMLVCPVCGTKEEYTENILMCNNCYHVFRNYPELNLQKYYSEEYRLEDSNKELADPLGYDVEFVGDETKTWEG